MKKRLQIILCEDAWTAVEKLTAEANEDYDSGTINYSDAINEMIISSKVDLRALQLKHADVRRSLRAMAARDIVDLDEVIKTLNRLKSRSDAKKTRVETTMELGLRD